MLGSRGLWGKCFKRVAALCHSGSFDALGSSRIPAAFVCWFGCLGLSPLLASRPALPPLPIGRGEPPAFLPAPEAAPPPPAAAALAAAASAAALVYWFACLGFFGSSAPPPAPAPLSAAEPPPPPPPPPPNDGRGRFRSRGLSRVGCLSSSAAASAAAAAASRSRRRLASSLTAAAAAAAAVIFSRAACAAPRELPVRLCSTSSVRARLSPLTSFEALTSSSPSR